MPVSLQDCLDEIDLKIERCLRNRAELSDRIAQNSEQIRSLTAQRTDAMVDLAKHYLPELSHQTLNQAWDEVRVEIRHLLLLRDDKRRQIGDSLEGLGRRLTGVQGHLRQAELDEQQARRDWSARNGNLQKALQEDPEIVRLQSQIQTVDQEMEIALNKMTEVSEIAGEKLPDYEACHLFQYLDNRKFGTADYQRVGVERRWDRWVARLIDYQQARKSYRYLTEAPKRLRDLIAGKQAHYKELLVRLEKVRDSNNQRYDLPRQERTIKKLQKQIQGLRQNLEVLNAEIRQHQEQLSHVNSVQGSHYQEAIEVYVSFLDRTKPEVLEVYASCTESPVDDEICARVRQFEKEMEEERSKYESDHIEIQRLGERTARLRQFASQIQQRLEIVPASQRFRENFPVDVVIADLLEQKCTIPDALEWLMSGLERVSPRIPVREPERVSAPVPNEQVEPLAEPIHSETVGDWLALTFFAASQQDDEFNPAAKFELPEGSDIDPMGILVQPALTESRSGAPSSPPQPSDFRALADCHGEVNQIYLRYLMTQMGVRHFVRKRAVQTDMQLLGDSQVPERVEDFDWHVLIVETERFNEARNMVLTKLQEFNVEWKCSECFTRVEPGHCICWRCGTTRPLSVSAVS